MKRYPALALVLVSATALYGCAPLKTQDEVSQIARRVGYLENEVVETRTEMNAVREDIHDQDLRLQFLEYEAVQRGEPIAPRRSMSTPDPTLASNGGKVVLPEPLTPMTSPAPTSSKPATSGQTAMSQAPIHTTQPAPVTQKPPVSSLPASPSSSSSPQGQTTPVAVTSIPVVPATPTNTPAKEPVTQPPVTPVVTQQAQTPAPGAVQSAQQANTQQPGSLPTTQAPQTQTVATAPAQPSQSVQVQTSASQPSQAATASEQKAYDAALQLYRTGRFAEAEAAFQAFLEVYPSSRFVPNALYWKGETYYARNMFADAIFAFKDVQTRFPQNQKSPDSLLKTAMAYQKLGDTANASLHLTVLYEDWPNAEATRQGKRMGLRP